MPKYTTSPPVTGIFVPDFGSYSADADGIFELPAEPQVEQALAQLGITLTLVEDPAPPATTGAGDPPADTIPSGADTVPASDAETLPGAEGADTIQAAEPAAGRRRKGAT